MKNYQGISNLLGSPVKSSKTEISDDYNISPAKKLKTSADKLKISLDEDAFFPPTVPTMSGCTSTNPPYPMFKAVDPVNSKKTLGIVLCLPLGIGNLK